MTALGWLELSGTAGLPPVWRRLRPPAPAPVPCPRCRAALAVERDSVTGWTREACFCGWRRVRYRVRLCPELAA